MEPSVFEKMSDRVIFSITKEIINKIDLDTVENSADWQFYEIVQTVCKLFSIDPSIQDTDFLYNIISMNDSILEEALEEKEEKEEEEIEEEIFELELNHERELISFIHNKITQFTQELGIAPDGIALGCKTWLDLSAEVCAKNIYVRKNAYLQFEKMDEIFGLSITLLARRNGVFLTISKENSMRILGK